MQTKGRVTHFVAGGSTGGTITGTGRFLKDMNPKIKVMLPDPVGSVFWDFWAKRIAEKDLEAKSYQAMIVRHVLVHAEWHALFVSSVFAVFVNATCWSWCIGQHFCDLVCAVDCSFIATVLNLQLLSGKTCVLDLICVYM